MGFHPLVGGNRCTDGGFRLTVRALTHAKRFACKTVKGWTEGERGR